MRRAILAVIAGGTLAAATACTSETRTTTDAAAPAPASPAPTAAPSTSPPPDYSADTRQVCLKLQTLYSGELKSFGTAMGKMITYKEAKQTADADKAETAAAAQLKAAGAKIRTATAAAEDPDLQAAGRTSAAKFEQSAKDRKYFDKVKTLKDLDSTVQAQFVEWLTPVAGYCGTA
jgi:hypothetical protein